MSEIQEKRLNLKALTQDPTEKETGDVNTSEEISDNSLNNTQDSKDHSTGDVQVSQAVESEITKTDKQDSASSTKMSFASIRKPVEEVPTEVKGEVKSETVIPDEEISVITNNEKSQSTHTGIEATETDVKKKSLETHKENMTEDKDEAPLGKVTSKTGEVVPVQNTEEKKKKRGLWFFKKKEKKAQDSQNISEENIEEKKSSDESQKVKFSNYESHFKKESTNFLSKFQQFRYTPKTRINLVLSLIGATICIIGSLMISMPQKHSPEIYKASIINIIGQETITETIPITSPKIEKEVDTQLPQEEVKTEEEIKISKQEESKEKLRQHLLNKYSG